MKVCSHQPSFLPWIGFWNKLLQCDRYIALGGVQYAHHDYQNRVKLAGSWLTLPVDRSTIGRPLIDVRVHDTAAAGVSLEKTICGRSYPYAGRIRPVIEYLKSNGSHSLLGVNLATMYLIRQMLGAKYTMRIDHLPPVKHLTKTQNVVEHTCRVVKGDEWFPQDKQEPIVYYAGAGALEYLNKDELGPLQVMVQRMKPTSNETILQLIARVEDPLSAVMEAATWESL